LVKVIGTAERYVIIALGNLLLINIYLPSNGACILNEVECLFDELSVYLDKYADYTPIWGGDFNVDLHVPSRLSRFVN